jgi:NAD(P)H-flavin reductase
MTYGFVFENLFYWIIFAGWLPILSTRVVLLDSFTWLRLDFVRESRSIGQFHLVEAPFCPREPLYWTVSPDWATILSTRVVLLDGFTWLRLHFVRESRSIGQFYLVEAPFCPRESFDWTVSLGWGSILSSRAALLDSFTWLRLHFVRESRSIGQFLLIDSSFCPRESFVTTEKSHFFM